MNYSNNSLLLQPWQRTARVVMLSRTIPAERSILLAFAPAHLLSGHPSEFVRVSRFIGTEHNIRVRVILMEKVSGAIWQQKRHFRDSVSVQPFNGP